MCLGATRRRKVPLTMLHPLWLCTGTAALEEDAQILRVIEAYCTGASLHQTTAGVRLCKRRFLLFVVVVVLGFRLHTLKVPIKQPHCFCVCSGAERVRPSGASARRREDHCGGDEEQRPDSY